MRSHE
jgi:hypothetical protein